MLRSSRSGSSSRTAVFFGRESGKLTLLAKGAMTEKSPFRGLLEPGNVVEAIYYFKEGRDLFYVKELSCAMSARKRPSSLEETGALLAALELIDCVTYTGNPETAVYDLLRHFLESDLSPGPLEALLAFQLRLLGSLGLKPSFDRCARCGVSIAEGIFDVERAESYCTKERPSERESVSLKAKLVELLAKAEELPIGLFARLDMDPSLRKEFGWLMHRIYTYHVQGYAVPKSFKLLKVSF